MEIRDADYLWGKSTSQTERIIKDEIGDTNIKVASIGQAGENLVKFACIMNDIDHAAGRCGLGAVMGSKNLKAVVVRGSNDIKIWNSKKFLDAVDEIVGVLQKDPETSIVRPKYGTTFLVTLLNEVGRLITRNLQTGVFEGAEKISGEALNERYLVKSRGCFGCYIGCDRYSAVTEGPFAGTYVGGPEYEVIMSFGSRCGNDNLPSIIKANELVNEYGLDALSAGGAISFAMECFEKGIITSRDADGLDLSWGNYEAILKLIELIAFRKGIGNILAEGSRAAAEIIGKGSQKYAMQVKGLDIPSGDPRAGKAFGLAYATSDRGADHLRGLPTYFERLAKEEEAIKMFGSPDAVKHHEWKGKGKAVKWHEELCAIPDMLGICKIASCNASRLEYLIAKVIDGGSKLYSAATGIILSSDELVMVAERVINLGRAYNVREGITRKDDTYPDRILKEPMPEGPAKGEVLELDPMLDEYYEARGWNKSTGIPTREKLLELGLEDVAEELKRCKKL